MNVAIITDLHFGFDKNSDLMLNNTLSFLKNQFIPYLVKNDIKTIFILGDLFDSRTAISTKIHNEVYDLFDIDFKDFNIHILLGNHDIFYNSSTDINSLKFLNKFENVTVVKKPRILHTNNKKILFVPWLIEQEEIIDIIDKHEADILMGHFDIVGFNFNKKVLSKNGISTNIFENKFNLVFSGHFHTRSVKNIKNTEFVYVGSPYQMTRADSNEERGFVVLNIETSKYKFISNEISSKFVTLNYPDNFTKEMISNNKVDINIKYNKNDYTPDEFDKYVKNVNKLDPATLNTFYIAESTLNEDFNINDCNFSSIPDLFKNYLDANDISTSKKEEIYNKFETIYKTVKGK